MRNVPLIEATVWLSPHSGRIVGQPETTWPARSVSHIKGTTLLCAANRVPWLCPSGCYMRTPVHPAKVGLFLSW